jgi:hypothetical protein
MGFTLGNLGLEDNVMCTRQCSARPSAGHVGALSFSVDMVVRPGLLKAISGSL